eukprot:gene27709-7353_t
MRVSQLDLAHRAHPCFRFNPAYQAQHKNLLPPHGRLIRSICAAGSPPSSEDRPPGHESQPTPSTDSPSVPSSPPNAAPPVDLTPASEASSDAAEEGKQFPPADTEESMSRPVKVDASNSGPTTPVPGKQGSIIDDVYVTGKRWSALASRGNVNVGSQSRPVNPEEGVTSPAPGSSDELQSSLIDAGECAGARPGDLPPSFRGGAYVPQWSVDQIPSSNPGGAAGPPADQSQPATPPLRPGARRSTKEGSQLQGNTSSSPRPLWSDYNQGSGGAGSPMRDTPAPAVSLPKAGLSDVGTQTQSLSPIGQDSGPKQARKERPREGAVLEGYVNLDAEIEEGEEEERVDLPPLGSTPSSSAAVGRNLAPIASSSSSTDTEGVSVLDRDSPPDSTPSFSPADVCGEVLSMSRGSFRDVEGGDTGFAFNSEDADEMMPGDTDEMMPRDADGMMLKIAAGMMPGGEVLSELDVDAAYDILLTPGQIESDDSDDDDEEEGLMVEAIPDPTSSSLVLEQALASMEEEDDEDEDEEEEEDEEVLAAAVAAAEAAVEAAEEKERKRRRKKRLEKESLASAADAIASMSSSSKKTSSSSKKSPSSLKIKTSKKTTSKSKKPPGGTNTLTIPPMPNMSWNRLRKKLNLFKFVVPLPIDAPKEVDPWLSENPVAQAEVLQEEIEMFVKRVKSIPRMVKVIIRAYEHAFLIVIACLWYLAGATLIGQSLATIYTFAPESLQLPGTQVAMKFTLFLNFLSDTVLERVSFAFQGWSSSSVPVKIAFVLLSAAPIILVFGTAYKYASGQPWSQFLRLTGLFTFAVFLSLVSDEVKRSFRSIKDGDYPVRSNGHVLVLNWSNDAIPLLRQLSHGKRYSEEPFFKRPIVVLAKKEKNDMDEDIVKRIPNTTLEIYTRTGSPASPIDLEMVAASSADTVIVLHPEASNGQCAEANKASIAMALTVIGARNVVFQMPTEVNPEVDYVQSLRKSLSAVSGKTSSQVLKMPDRNFMDRFTCHAAVQPGMLRVWQKILQQGPSNVKLRVVRLPSCCVDMPYVDVRRSYNDAVVMGFTRGSEVNLGPQEKQKLAIGDKLIMMSYVTNPKPDPGARAFFSTAGQSAKERMLRSINYTTPPRKIPDDLSLPGRWGVCRFNYQQNEYPTSLKALQDAGIKTTDSVVLTGLADNVFPSEEADCITLAGMLQVQHAVTISGRTTAPHVVARVDRGASLMVAQSYFSRLAKDALNAGSHASAPTTSKPECSEPTISSASKAEAQQLQLQRERDMAALREREQLAEKEAGQKEREREALALRERERGALKDQKDKEREQRELKGQEQDLAAPSSGKKEKEATAKKEKEVQSEKERAQVGAAAKDKEDSSRREKDAKQMREKEVAAGQKEKEAQASLEKEKVAKKQKGSDASREKDGSLGGKEKEKVGAKDSEAQKEQGATKEKSTQLAKDQTKLALARKDQAYGKDSQEQIASAGGLLGPKEKEKPSLTEVVTGKLLGDANTQHAQAALEAIQDQLQTSSAKIHAAVRALLGRLADIPLLKFWAPSLADSLADSSASESLSQQGQVALAKGNQKTSPPMSSSLAASAARPSASAPPASLSSSPLDSSTANWQIGDYQDLPAVTCELAWEKLRSARTNVDKYITEMSTNENPRAYRCNLAATVVLLGPKIPLTPARTVEASKQQSLKFKLANTDDPTYPDLANVAFLFTSKTPFTPLSPTTTASTTATTGANASAAGGGGAVSASSQPSTGNAKKSSDNAAKDSKEAKKMADSAVAKESKDGKKLSDSLAKDSKEMKDKDAGAQKSEKEGLAKNGGKGSDQKEVSAMQLPLSAAKAAAKAAVTSLTCSSSVSKAAPSQIVSITNGKGSTPTDATTSGSTSSSTAANPATLSNQSTALAPQAQGSSNSSTAPKPKEGGFFGLWGTIKGQPASSTAVPKKKRLPPPPPIIRNAEIYMPDEISAALLAQVGCLRACSLACLLA